MLACRLYLVQPSLEGYLLQIALLWGLLGIMHCEIQFGSLMAYILSLFASDALICFKLIILLYTALDI